MSTTTIASGSLTHDPIGDTYNATVRLPPIHVTVDGIRIKASVGSRYAFSDVITAACVQAVADIVIAEWRRLQAEEKAKIDRCWHE